MNIGYHLSLSNYKNFEEAINSVKKNKVNIIQIFLSNPRSGKIKDKEVNVLKTMRRILEKNKIKCYVHSSYTINIAKNWDKYSWWIKTLEKEFEYAEHIGAKGIVIHLGKKLQLSQSEAYNNMYSAIAYIINKTQNTKVKLLLETSSGQGTELGYKLEDFAFFFDKLKKIKTNRIKICIDSCHIFVAGYDLKSEKKFKEYINKFNKLIGIEYIELIHINDSKKDVGSRLDRHEDIGKGKIGLKNLKRFYNYFNKIKIPMILETPSKEYKKDINKLIN